MQQSKLLRKMGSQLSSYGLKYSETVVSRGGDDCSVDHVKEVTNSNARDHSQPDRLKLLFRDHRGYRAMSEQKVSEWLSSNKQFYNSAPKDLVEIPDHIFGPNDANDTDWRNDKTSSAAQRSENSGTNRQLRNQDSEEVPPARNYRDKMNHFFQRNATSKQVHNSSHTNSKAVILGTRSGKKMLEFEPQRSYATVESTSSKLVKRNSDLFRGGTRNLRNGTLRRDSHSVAPRPSAVSQRKPIDGWLANGNCVGARKTLPSMLQNNSFHRPKVKACDSRMEPHKGLAQTLSLKRQTVTQHAIANAIPKRERFHRKSVTASGERHHCLLDAQPDLLRLHRSRSHSSVWRSPYSVKKLQRFATLWLGGTEKTCEPYFLK